MIVTILVKKKVYKFRQKIDHAQLIHLLKKQEAYARILIDVFVTAFEKVSLSSSIDTNINKW